MQFVGLPCHLAPQLSDPMQERRLNLPQIGMGQNELQVLVLVSIHQGFIVRFLTHSQILTGGFANSQFPIASLNQSPKFSGTGARLRS